MPARWKLLKYELSKNQAVTYNYTTSKFKTMLMYDVYKLDRHYFLPLGYEPSKQGLKKFANDFFTAVNKLKDNPKLKKDNFLKLDELLVKRLKQRMVG